MGKLRWEHTVLFPALFVMCMILVSLLIMPVPDPSKLVAMPGLF